MPHLHLAAMPKLMQLQAVSDLINNGQDPEYNVKACDVLKEIKALGEGEMFTIFFTTYQDESKSGYR